MKKHRAIKKMLIILSVLIVTLAGVSVTAAQDLELVCYLSGGNWNVDPSVPNGSTFTSVIYDAQGNIFSQRTVVAQSSAFTVNWGFLPVFAPRGGFEVISAYIPSGPLAGNYPNLFGYAVNDFILPGTACTGIPIGDGRLNDGDKHIAAPVAVYCGGDGSIRIYAIDEEDGHGTEAIIATGAEIEQAAASARDGGVSVLIGEYMGINFWASPHNELAVISPALKDPGVIYRFDFPSNACGTAEAPTVIQTGPATSSTGDITLR